MSGASGPDPKAGGFAVTVAFELAPGAFDAFRQRIAENAALSVAREPGCLRFDILTPLDRDGAPAVFLYEIYRDREAFAQHLASDHYLRFDAETRALISRKTVSFFSVEENARGGGAS